jgi:hypothetical protein
MAQDLTGWLEKLQKLNRKRRRQPAFSIMQFIMQRVNVDGANLSELARDLGPRDHPVDRDTLERNLMRMGYIYRPSGTLVQVNITGPEG